MKTFLKELSRARDIYILSSNPIVEKKLNSNDVFVDWVGRPYIYIDIPEEYVGASPTVIDSMLALKIQEHGQIIANMGYRGYLNLYPQHALDILNKKALIIFTYEYIYLRNKLLLALALLIATTIIIITTN